MGLTLCVCVCVAMVSHICASVHTQRYAHARGSGPQATWAPGANSQLPAPVGKLCPHTGVSSRQLENKEMQPRSTQPAPRPLELLCLCSPCKASLWIANILIHRTQGGGRCGDWGSVAATPLPSSRPSPAPDPPKWQQHPKTCSGVLVPYTTKWTGWQHGRLVGAGALLAPPSLGLCHRAGRGWSAHRVLTATG